MIPQLSEIKKRRKALGLTQSGLARRAGVSQSLIAKVESGRLDPAYGKARKIFEALDAEAAGKGRKASDIMASPVITISQEEKLGMALRIMREKGISTLPVVEGGKCIGSVSEDLILALVGKGHDLKRLEGSEVRLRMGPSLPQVGMGASYSSLIGLLRESGTVLVVEAGEIVGIVTKADLVKT